MRYAKKSIKSALLALVLFVSACSTPVQTTPIVEQQSMMISCTQDTPIPEDKTGKALMKALIGYQKIYNECASRNDALIRLIKGLRDYDKKV